jgi:hypothetical protein
VTTPFAPTIGFAGLIYAPGGAW